MVRTKAPPEDSTPDEAPAAEPRDTEPEDTQPQEAEPEDTKPEDTDAAKPAPAAGSFGGDASLVDEPDPWD